MFLIPLLGGILIALVSLASVISHFLEEEPIRTAAVFFGLVVGSVLTSIRLVRRWDRTLLATSAVVAVAAFVLLGLGSGQVEDPSLPYVFVGGMIAICAMILPGISGSFLLLMLGLYHGVLDAVDERDLAVIAVFGVGAVIGLAGFSSVLSWALDRYEQLHARRADRPHGRLPARPVAVAERHRQRGVDRRHRARPPGRRRVGADPARRHRSRAHLPRRPASPATTAGSPPPSPRHSPEAELDAMCDRGDSAAAHIGIELADGDIVLTSDLDDVDRIIGHRGLTTARAERI